MITTNELAKIKCDKRKILEPLITLVSPFAPHLAEELWMLAGHKASVTSGNFPVFNPELIKEEMFDYPVSVNGKLRTKCNLPLNIMKEEMEKIISGLPEVLKWTEGKKVSKIIFVQGKIINVVAM